MEYIKHYNFPSLYGRLMLQPTFDVAIVEASLLQPDDTTNHLIGLLSFTTLT